MRIKRWDALALVAVVVLSFARPGLAADSDAGLEEVRRRYLAPVVMEGLDPTAPEARAAAAALDRAVADLLASQITDPQADGFGGWDPQMDITSKEISFNGRYFQRTARLARAWACPASKYYRSQAVATALNRAIERAMPILEAHKRPNNWWAWDIGIPNRLGDALLCAGDALAPAIRRRAVREQVHLTKKNQLRPRGGANTAWCAIVRMRTALLADDPALLQRASATMSGLLTGRDAIGPDYSYFFHGPGLNVGYGFAHWEATSEFARVTDGTRWSLTPAASRELRNWTNEFFRWNAWRGTWSPWTLGRACSRPYYVSGEHRPTGASAARNAPNAGRPPLDLANVGSWPRDRRGAFLAMAAEHGAGAVATGEDPSAYYLWKTAGVEPAPPAYGTKYFPRADYLAARRPGWYAAVRLNSTRTKTWFTLHNENLLGHEQAEGSLALMTRPDDFAYDRIVCMPYDDLPGVTRQQGLARPHDAKGEATQTGGVALDDVALAGFDYKLSNAEKSLRANKSYLLLPNAIVLVGSGITSRAPGDVSTTICLVPRRQDDSSWLVDGDARAWDDQQSRLSGRHWFRLGDVGVVALAPMDLCVAIRTIEATSRRINQTYGTGETYRNQFGGVRAEHGDNPSNGTYAAAILPGASPEEVAAMAAAPKIHLLANTAKTHAIRADEGITAVSFFDADRIEDAAGSDGPAYLLLKETRDRVQMAVMVPPADGFETRVTRTIWLPGRYDLASLPEDVVGQRDDRGGTSLALSLTTGSQTTLTLSRVP
ncbi:MAG: hypothetical protein JW809_10980 [Pirellulales bacterium]|nr:hypothetical protein [Pirellulales bacterium]